jgi:ABC-type polysaccharide/polyol phosphate transport system ATPase subunit
MSMPTVAFENVSKRYPRGGVQRPRYASLRHDLASIGTRARARLRGRTIHEHGTLALDDVSFEIEEGESFALIGPNGAGKSTALKLVSRISSPTGGTVKLRGRVAALMEVGSGVHPELTGRENIWLYGQILGMTKSEVRSRFDEIVEFSELADAIDTPVKFFSSGMQVRLGFSIAAFLDPDIFVVDEALAVGDASFQTKCVERMTKLVAEGRTLLFVSHNLFMVEAVCARGVLLLDGRVEKLGDIRGVLSRYISLVDEGYQARRRSDQEIHGAGLDLLSVTLHDPTGAERYAYAPGERFDIRMRLKAHQDLRNCYVSIGVSDGHFGPVAFCSMLEREQGVDLKEGEQTITCRLGRLPLRPRNYDIGMSVRDSTGAAEVLPWSPVAVFRVGDVVDGYGVGSTSLSWLSGPLRIDHEWSVEP